MNTEVCEWFGSTINFSSADNCYYFYTNTTGGKGLQTYIDITKYDEIILSYKFVRSAGSPYVQLGVGREGSVTRDVKSSKNTDHSGKLMLNVSDLSGTFRLFIDSYSNAGYIYL